MIQYLKVSERREKLVEEANKLHQYHNRDIPESHLGCFQKIPKFSLSRGYSILSDTYGTQNGPVFSRISETLVLKREKIEIQPAQLSRILRVSTLPLEERCRCRQT